MSLRRLDSARGAALLAAAVVVDSANEEGLPRGREAGPGRGRGPPARVRERRAGRGREVRRRGAADARGFERRRDGRGRRRAARRRSRSTRPRVGGRAGGGGGADDDAAVARGAQGGLEIIHFCTLDCPGLRRGRGA